MLNMLGELRAVDSQYYQHIPIRYGNKTLIIFCISFFLTRSVLGLALISTVRVEYTLIVVCRLYFFSTRS